jgi:sec-independent protein translocase protein TatA
MVLLFVSASELLVVFAFALIFFGAKSIPEIAKVLGKGMREFHKAANEIQREFEDSTSDIRKELNDASQSLENDARKIIDQVKKMDDPKQKQ